MTYPMALARTWVDRLRNAQADHHAIARGMAMVMLFVLLATAARAAREMAIAYRYGVMADVDAYLFLFNLISWPIAVWFSVLSVVLIPHAARIKQQTPQDLRLFRAELLGFTGLMGLGLGLLGWVAMPWILKSSLAGLSARTSEIAVSMVSALVFVLPLGMIISLFSVWILADGRHVNTLIESVPALTVVAVLIFVSGYGIDALVWGTVGGFALHLLFLGMVLRTQDDADAPRFTLRSPQWSIFLQGLGIVLIGQALMSFAGVIDQFFAAHLGTGAIAKLNYGNRLLTVILSLGATAVTRATLPVFSYAPGVPHLRRIAMQWVGMLFIVGGIALLLGWWAAPWVVYTVFEHGEFTAQDTQVVTEVFRYGLLQVPFYFSAIVLVSWLASQTRYHVIAGISALLLVIKLIANFTLVPTFGLRGIVLGTALMYFGSLLFCWLAAARNP